MLCANIQKKDKHLKKNVTMCHNLCMAPSKCLEKFKQADENIVSITYSFLHTGKKMWLTLFSTLVTPSLCWNTMLAASCCGGLSSPRTGKLLRYDRIIIRAKNWTILEENLLEDCKWFETGAVGSSSGRTKTTKPSLYWNNLDWNNGEWCN